MGLGLGLGSVPAQGQEREAERWTKRRQLPAGLSRGVGTGRRMQDKEWRSAGVMVAHHRGSGIEAAPTPTPALFPYPNTQPLESSDATLQPSYALAEHSPTRDIPHPSQLPTRTHTSKPKVTRLP